MSDSDYSLYLRRLASLESERSSWIAHYQEISDHLLPRSGRFFSQDRNNGARRHNNIYDSTGTRSLRVLGAGLMGGATSPARPWFRMGTADKELMKSEPVKIWLADVTKLMFGVFQKSNTYRTLHHMYEEQGAFGTAATIVVDDFDRVIHHYGLTAGEYCIAQDWRGEICTIYREFQKTVGEIVKEFGKENCSMHVRDHYDRGNLDVWVTIIHAIEPRADRDIRKRDSKNMPFKSVYFEKHEQAKSGKVLREGGYKQFPALVPRWATAGGDIYGNGPGMEALGDIKQLQHEQLRKAQGIDYMTKPPLQVPISMKNSSVETLPGGISFVDTASPTGGIRTAFEVNLNLRDLGEDIRDVRERIRDAFYVDMFLMLSNDQRSGTTAYEVAERHEEKLLMLGPTVERLHNELLDPLVNMTFDRLLESGALPPPPPELSNQEINIEYISMLAQAQRAVATNGVDRFVVSLGNVASFKPGVLDKFDEDRWAEEYSDMLGVDPSFIVPDAKVAIIRQQRAQQEQAAQQAAMVNQGADTAQKLGSVDTGGQNAAADIMQMFSQ